MTLTSFLVPANHTLLLWQACHQVYAYTQNLPHRNTGKPDVWNFLSGQPNKSLGSHYTYVDKKYHHWVRISLHSCGWKYHQLLYHYIICYLGVKLLLSTIKIMIYMKANAIKPLTLYVILKNKNQQIKHTHIMFVFLIFFPYLPFILKNNFYCFNISFNV